MNILLIVAIIAVGAGAYAWSLRRYPKRDCWLCHGRNRENDKIWLGAFGASTCWACKGRGYRVRWGVWLFMRETYQSIKDGQHGKYY